MTISAARAFAVVAALACAFWSTPASSQLGVGVWVKQDSGSQKPLTMTVEECCNGGRRLTYFLGDLDLEMVVESAFDGSEAQVLIAGKPSGETMAITRVDSHHTSTIIRMNGKPFGTSKAELSADGNKLTVRNEYAQAAGGHAAGVQNEVWIRK